MKGKLKMKTYLFGFVGGGWNSIQAKTKRGANLLADKLVLVLDPEGLLGGKAAATASATAA